MHHLPSPAIVHHLTAEQLVTGWMIIPDENGVELQHPWKHGTIGIRNDTQTDGWIGPVSVNRWGFRLTVRFK